MFIDAHTHQKDPIYLSLIMGKHALGIHPWDVLAPFNGESLRRKFIEIAEEKMLAIGECGLDRAREGLANIEEQAEVLKWHFDLARKNKLPLIIHCVRAHSDLLGILKKHKWQAPFMLHDFSGNEKQIAEYLKFQAYFSLGKRVFKDHLLLRSIPKERLLLETDDQSDVGIDLLYKEAAAVLNLPISEFEEQLEKNFLTFFSETYDVRSPDFIKNFR